MTCPDCKKSDMVIGIKSLFHTFGCMSCRNMAPGKTAKQAKDSWKEYCKKKEADQ